MYDAVIVGSGAGGGTISQYLAKRGFRVAIVERGEEGGSVQRCRVRFNGQFVESAIAHTLGGSTRLFGGIMMRPARRDFQPGKFYAQYIPREDWEWPFDYESLAPHYELAEDLFTVAGAHQTIGPHIPQRNRPFPETPWSLTAANRSLLSRWQQSGLSAFRLPFAVSPSLCLKCPTCPGRPCPAGARSSAANRGVEAALRTGNAQLFTGFRADSLSFTNRKNARGVELTQRGTRKKLRLEARLIILAAGALETPRILLNAGLASNLPALGRYLSFHAGVMGVGAQRISTRANDVYSKQLGSTELYFGTSSFSHKLGLMQHIPLPRGDQLPRFWKKDLLQRGLGWVINHTQSFGLMLEDLPSAINKVTYTRDGVPHVHHRFHSYDLFRLNGARKLLRQTLELGGCFAAATVDNENARKHISHVVGTARAGRSPRNSVVNEHCRVHRLDNVYVVDGSVFPTSLGVGPALTIAANALRVGAHIAG